VNGDDSRKPVTLYKIEEDIGLKTIELRLTSLKEAVQRTRFVFVVLTIASSAILFTLWNDRLSRDKSLAFDSGIYTEDKVKDRKLEPLFIWGTREVAEEWYESRVIHIGLLGIHVSVGDLSVVGSFSLFVIAIWFYYSHKRENHALVALLRDVNRDYTGADGLKVRDMVYQGIRHNLIFIETEKNDEPFYSLEEATPGKPSAEAAEGSNESAGPAKRRRSFTNGALGFLSFLPFWTIVAIISRDVAALAMESPTSGQKMALWYVIWGAVECRGRGFSHCMKSLNPIFLIAGFAVISIVAAYYTYKLCKKSRKFAEGSKEALEKFKSTLQPD
jgi:hypothetical protein